MVDTISSLVCCEYEHDQWIDAPLAARKKGLMLPPGLGFNAMSQKLWRHHNLLPEGFILVVAGND